MKFWRPLFDSIAYDPVPGAYRILAIIVVVVLALFALVGCAQPGPLTGVCALRPFAEKGGITYVQYHCEPSEHAGDR